MRELKLSRHRVLLMTDLGLDHMRSIVETMHLANISDGLANYSDMYAACRHVIENCLSRGVQPDGADELIHLTLEELNREIDTRYFVVPIFGIKLLDVDSFDLGNLKIVHADTAHFDNAAVSYHQESVVAAMKLTKIDHWLLGSVLGTASKGEEKFRSQAELVVGLLAVAAASMYQGGASRFRIGIVMSPNVSYGKYAWFSWPEKTGCLTTHHKFLSAREFEIDRALINEFAEAEVMSFAFAFFQSETRSDLEEAIVKAIYWYADAHQEGVPVMKLVKYWSCVEVFFSAENVAITKSVSAGLASVLVFGGFKFVPVENYISTKKKIANWYALRSKALHGGAYRHVSNKDVDDLSQWVAWMIINMIAFVKQGYTHAEQIKAECERLDAVCSSH
jgi:hypothetical protein